VSSEWRGQGQVSRSWDQGQCHASVIKYIHVGGLSSTETQSCIMVNFDACCIAWYYPSEAIVNASHDADVRVYVAFLVTSGVVRGGTPSPQIFLGAPKW